MVRDWRGNVAAPAELAETLKADYKLAMLFRDLATLRTEVEVFDSVDQLRWRGPTPASEEIGPRLDAAVFEKEAKHHGKRRHRLSKAPS